MLETRKGDGRKTTYVEDMERRITQEWGIGGGRETRGMGSMPQDTGWVDERYMPGEHCEASSVGGAKVCDNDQHEAAVSRWPYCPVPNAAHDHLSSPIIALLHVFTIPSLDCPQVHQTW